MIVQGFQFDVRSQRKQCDIQNIESLFFKSILEYFVEDSRKEFQVLFYLGIFKQFQDMSE